MADTKGGVWELLHARPEGGSDYYNLPRTEVVDLIERAPVRVLELGCGAGITGALVKQKFPGVVVIGIEPDRGAADLAAPRIDRVIAARLEEIDFAREGIAPGSIDLILAADVLEHMVDPWQALRTLRPLLAATGTLIASLPNVRNLALLEQLADRGRWRYAPFGLLDVTHLRFFTRREMLNLLVESGYRVKLMNYKLDPELVGVYTANRKSKPINLVRGRLRLENLSSRDLKELCSIQILVVASPRSPGGPA